MQTIDMKDAIQRIKGLPTLPSVLGKILATAADPESSAVDLGKHIAADQSLSATLLKLVNSAYYGFYRQISSVTQAIVMLGFLEVRNLTLTATAFRTLGRPASDQDRLQLWRHSLATAMAAERIAKMLKSEREGCFEAGLLHDIGKVALDAMFPDRYREAVRKARTEERALAETTKEIFGMDHAEVGGLLAEHWNLPPGVCEAIRFHLRPEAAQTDPRLTQITCLANFITYTVDFGESGNGRAPEFPAGAAQALGFTQALGDELSKELTAKREKIDELLGALKSAG